MWSVKNKGKNKTGAKPLTLESECKQENQEEWHYISVTANKRISTFFLSTPNIKLKIDRQIDRYECF